MPAPGENEYTCTRCGVKATTDKKRPDLPDGWFKWRFDFATWRPDGEAARLDPKAGATIVLARVAGGGVFCGKCHTEACTALAAKARL